MVENSIWTHSMIPAALSSDTSLDILATRRERSLFSSDIEARQQVLARNIAGSRILLVGGAGSIGSATLRRLLAFGPDVVHVVDSAENELAELVRDLRSRLDVRIPRDLRLLPIDYGSVVTERFLQAEPAYDSVLLFAAHKHVRSEKDVPSVLQMFDTNVVKLRRFLGWLGRHGRSQRCFSVSTDKAANPTSLMGASKRLMEHTLFAQRDVEIATSARFANVAFSNGSLLQSFLIRLTRRQPIAVPRDVSRYFVTASEAAEICLLAAFATPGGHIAFPKLDPKKNLVSLCDIAFATIRHFGFEPAIYDDEARAIEGLERDIANGQHPVIVTPLDTSGEKSYEEFVGDGETSLDLGLRALAGIRYAGPPPGFGEAIAFIERAVSDATVQVSKPDFVARLMSVIPNLHHRETGRTQTNISIGVAADSSVFFAAISFLRCASLSRRRSLP